MSLLIFSFQRQKIIQLKSDLNMKLIGLKLKLMDLQSYASSIADGTVSMNDLMNSPPSQFGRMSIFMMYSHQAAMAGAQQKFGLMSQTPGVMPPTQDPNLQQQYQYMLFKNLYEQERQNFSKMEAKMLNEQNKKIEQEVAQVETQLKMIEAQENSVKEAEAKAAENSAPKYVA